MPLGLPNHLAPNNVSRAYARSSHVAALICIIAALLTVTGLQSAFPALTLWPAIVALLPLGLMLVFLDRQRTTFAAAAYLLIGAACVYWYGVTATIEYSVAGQTDSFVVTLPKLALIFVGAGTTARSMIAWAVAGYVLAEAAVSLVAVQAGGLITPDGATILTLVCIIGGVLIISFSRRFTVAAQSGLNRAARDEQVSTVRYRIEVKAAAIMHDTVLGHLAAISSSTPGALAPDLRAQMTRDLEVLIGEEWLLDADIPDATAGTDWRASALFAAIAESRELGLDVDVSGDVSAIARLEREHAQAVALAAKQCLVNVIRHAGVTSAEVVIYGSDDEVSVMVVDAGKGFSEAEAGADRLGLRQSVRQRIVAVDGTVQVWSTPGRGTSVMIRVPARARADGGS
jgi:signal transduction histidine kinase